MPHTIARPHPFKAATRQDTFFARGVFVGSLAFDQVGEGRDARMRMHSKSKKNGPPEAGILKKTRNTKGLRCSPRTRGLISRVIGPCVLPRVR